MIHDGSAMLTMYVGNAKTFIVPPSVVINGNSYAVTRINYASFAHCKDLTNVTIPSSVTNIGMQAFFNNPSLTIFLESTSNPDELARFWTDGSPIAWGCVLSADKAYVVSFTKTAVSIINPYMRNIASPYRDGFNFIGWNTTADGNGTFYPLTNKAECDAVPDSTTLYAIWVKN